MKRLIIKITAVVIAIVTMTSACDCKHEPDNTGYDHVMILYSAGYNSLSSYLRNDIKDLQNGYLPRKSSKDAVVVVSHLSNNGDYQTAVPPVIVQYIHGSKGPIADTLQVYSEETCLTKASDMKRILSDVKRMFPSEHYGIVFSSHSTGWLPKGYYANSKDFDFKSPGGGKALAARHVSNAPEGAVPYNDELENEFPGMPAVKSIGMTNRTISGQKYSYEMELAEFADSIPFHLDYLLLDACLSGGIEVAYELKDVCDITCFSQAEVLAEGFNYLTLASNLLEHNSDAVAVARDYFTNYTQKEFNIERSATISVIDCTKLDGLASVCSTLFEKYRDNIAAVDHSSVQRYYRGGHHWFYDMEDILVKAGMDESDHRQLSSALGACVLYNEATEQFLGAFDIDTHCGFSMYLPNNGSAYLDSFYKTLKWNKATKLVD